MRSSLALVVAGAGLLGEAHDGEAQAVDQGRVTAILVHGDRNPELIPESFAWTSALRALVTASGPEGEAAAGLARYELFMPPADVRMILAEGKVALAEVERIHSSGQPHWAPEQWNRMYREADVPALACRDRLKATLPPRSFRALERFVNKSKRGMSYSYGNVPTPR